VVESFRQGVLVKPYERLNQDHVKWLDQSSLDILSDPGIWCYNERAAKLFKSHGANVRSFSRATAPTSGKKAIRMRNAGG